MAKPAARITDPTSCPIPGHGAKAVASGSPDVFFDSLAAARQGDTCTCGSALASVVSATVFINGKNAALVGTKGTHGDVVVSGSGTVIIGTRIRPRYSFLLCHFPFRKPMDKRSVLPIARQASHWLFGIMSPQSMVLKSKALRMQTGSRISKPRSPMPRFHYT